MVCGDLFVHACFIVSYSAGRVKVKESEGRPGDGGRKRKRVQDLSSDEEVPGNL